MIVQELTYSFAATAIVLNQVWKIWTLAVALVHTGASEL